MVGPFGDASRQVLNELGGRRSRSWHQLDIAYGKLARIAVGFADGGCEQNVRGLQQRLLDQGRIDVVAAADDDILGPSGHEHKAVTVDAPEIAGDQPAVLGAGAAVMLRIDVAGRETRSSDLQHADLVEATNPRRSVGRVDHCPNLRIGQSNADPPSFALPSRGSIAMLAVFSVIP
jgi:hypothetical protein